MRRLPFQAVCVSLVLIAGRAAVAADASEEEELARIYGDKSFVSIATGTRQNLTRAPAVATVITAQDIEALGAADLDQVLESVPGLHVSPLQTYAGKSIYIFRGIYSQYNPQVLLLVNGVPMTTVYLGDRGDVWAGMPLDNVARIEVIRGPGSALYGADAFAGVINVITKSAVDIAGSQLGVRVGSFKSRDAWALHGASWGPWQVAAYLRYGRNDFETRPIEADAQTGLDALFGTHASLAPAPIRVGYEAFDAQLELTNGPWRWHAGYKRRSNVQLNALASALGGGDVDAERFTTDLGYDAPNVAPDWDLSLQASYLDYNKQARTVLFPPGAFGGAFPNGMIGTPEHWERATRLSASTIYKGWQDHRIRLGVGRDWLAVYKTRETKNFDLVFVPGIGTVPTPLPTMVDVSDTAPYLRPHARRVSYAYAQDEWQLAPDWSLTAGLRHDRYTDFGGTTNPRLALVWAAAYNMTAKLLYGRAFRPPSFTELYNINNPVALGNPNLRPETIATSEAAFAWQPSAALRWNLSLFRYRMRDVLRFVPNADPTTGATAQNAGGQTGRGFEIEGAWDASKSLRLSGNYAQQRSIDEPTQQDAGMAPHHHLYLRADWRARPGWLLGTQFNWVAGRERQPGDTRPKIADYRTVDLTLRTDRRRQPWDFAISVRNLFDVDAREPSAAPGLIPNDLPLLSRSVVFEATLSF